MASTTTALSYSPLRLEARSLPWQIAAVGLGTLFLALSSHVEVPMVPVPMTMQTLAVVLIGALYGWRLGGVTVIAWLIEAAIGLPVLASGGAPGILVFAGNTAGYLFSFPLVAALVGWLAERGWNGSKPVLAFAAAILGHVLCLTLGFAWLATLIGADQAITYGVTPFLVGTVLKSVLAAAMLFALQRGTAAKGEH